MASSVSALAAFRVLRASTGLRLVPRVHHRWGSTDAGTGPGTGPTPFKSRLHPDNLYPESKFEQRLSAAEAPPKPNQEEDGLPVTPFDGFIPLDKVKITTYAATPGRFASSAQTAVDIRFHLDSATWLSDQVREKVREAHSSTLSADGFLVVKSNRTRSQLLNRADALRKLRDAIWSSLLPKPDEADEVIAERSRKRIVEAARQSLRVKKEKTLIRNALK